MQYETTCSATTDSVEARQQVLAAALAHRSNGRYAGRSGRSARSSRLRLDADEYIARAAQSSIDLSHSADPAQGALTGAATLDGHDLATHLRAISHRSTLVQAAFIDALARFDELEVWRTEGAKNCAGWVCSELGVSRSLAYSQLAVARALRNLPIIARLFRTGDLSWSKVQALARIATPDDERALAIMALDLDANAVQQICDEYRWGKYASSSTDDVERDRQRFERRSLAWSTQPDGSLAFRAILPPDMAANFLACLEHQESLEFTSRSRGDTTDTIVTDTGSLPVRSAAQRRADALVAMSEASLEAAGNGVSTADRFQVVVHVDADALDESIEEVSASAHATNGACGCTGGTANPDVKGGTSSTDLDCSQEPCDGVNLPLNPPSSPTLPLPIRAAVAGVGGISPAVARRLACDGSLVTVIMKNGEPLSVGRKTRRWSSAIRRAVLARDGGCTFPGCGSTRNLDIHHVHGWALGGETSVETGATLCRSCHTRVHDEGWRIQRAPADTPPVRHCEAVRLLANADERTRIITGRLDARRSHFRFERVTRA